MQFPIFISSAEAFFYFPHRWLHTEWAFAHIHYIHHKFHAPIAFAAAYSHPIEFLLSNVVPFCAGPLLCGAHMSTWLLWGAIGTMQISLAHLGFQFPFLGQRQSHDWHHSSGPGMYDISFGIMDALFETDDSYNSSWQSTCAWCTCVSLIQILVAGTCAKNYNTPDYPVDKILASQDAKKCSIQSQC